MTKKLLCLTALAFLAAWPGAPQARAGSWANLGSGLGNEGVLGLAFDTSGNLYAGGQFATAGGSAATNIAQWNASAGAWTNLAGGMNARIWSLACDTNGNLYAGGSFTTAGGVAATNIAQWNASAGAWTNLAGGMGDTVFALAFDTNGNLYAGGSFTNIGNMAANRVAQWNGSAWTNLAGGIQTDGGSVYALAFDTNGNLYAGGDGFTDAGGVAATNIAQWNASAGAWTNLAGGMNAAVYDLACDTNGNLYAGGSFTTAGDIAATNIAQWNASAGAWTNLAGGIRTDGGCIYALALDPGGNLYAGGDFAGAGSVAAANIAKWNGSAWTNLGSGMNSVVYDLACDTNANRVYAGGFFTIAGDVSASHVAQWTDWAGRIGLAPASLAYTATSGLANPAAQAFVMTNNGQAAFNFTNTASYSANSGTNIWLTLSAAAGSVSVAGSLAITGSVNIANLNEGIYSAAYSFTAANADNSPQILTVTLRVLNGTEGRISLVPAALTYTATNGLANPADQAFAVRNSGLTAFLFTNTVSYSANSDTNTWFTPSVTAGLVSADRSLVVTGSVAVAGLSEGTYYATNTIAAENAANSPQTLVVTLRVLNGSIGFVPAALAYTADYGLANPADQAFAVTNAGQAAFNFTNTTSYSANSGANAWFTPSASTGRIPAAGSLAMTGSVNIAGLSEGTYYATNAITAPEATNSPQKMVVTLDVLNPSKKIWVSTPGEKKVTEGQGPVWDTIQIANTGTVPRGVLTYVLTATSGPPAWLSVSPTNAGDVQYNTNTANLVYMTTNLSAGWYTGQVCATPVGDAGSRSVDVRLQVNHRPGLAWDAAGKIWTNDIIAGGSLADTTIAVWNASGTPAGQMNYTLSVLADPYGWVSSVNPASGGSTGDHQVVTVSYTTAGLPAGIYTAQLMVEGKDAATGEPSTNGPLFMGLQLTVKGSLPVLKTDTTILSQTVLENYTATNSFLVWNEGRDPRGDMRYTVNPDVSWVTASPATGVVTTGAAAVQVLWNTNGPGLSPGTNLGTLRVDAQDTQTGTPATGSPLTIPLKLIVTPRTPMNLELPAVVGTMFIGQTLTTNAGLWQNQARLTFTCQWERAATRAGGGREILGGTTESNYVITAADRGKYLRVALTATDPLPFPKSATAYSAWADTAKVRALRADFNGDGITDLWFFDELSGAWNVSFGATNSGVMFFGGPGMTAVPGDYDGDGNEDLGVYERARGMWHILYLPRCAYACGSLFGGTPEEAAATPVPADYDGDGATDVALYWRGNWVVYYSSRKSVSVVKPFAWEGTPVSGDWDGDGVTEMGVYANGTWTLRFEDGSIAVQEFGGSGSGALPAPGDYDGDGTTDLGVHDTSANQWRWRSSWTGSNMTESFGPCGGWPLPGYYEHDRKEDFAQVFVHNNDYYVWLVKRTLDRTIYPYLYYGQSYQLSTGRWRVSW